MEWCSVKKHRDNFDDDDDDDDDDDNNNNNWTEQSAQEANSYSASQEIHPPFMKPEVSLPCSQGPATSPYPEPDAVA
jgi:hypothetical protein